MFYVQTVFFSPSEISTTTQLPLREHAGESKRVALFARILGVLDEEPPVSAAGFELLLKAINRAHAWAGPLFGEVSLG